MIERDLNRAEGSKAVRCSGSQFGFVVENNCVPEDGAERDAADVDRLCAVAHLRPLMERFRETDSPHHCDAWAAARAALSSGISAGFAMIVVAPVTVIAGRIWVNPPLLEWGGLLVIAAGVALCWWAKLHLGRLWSANVTHKQGHRMVDSGPPRPDAE